MAKRRGRPRKDYLPEDINKNSIGHTITSLAKLNGLTDPQIKKLSAAIDNTLKFYNITKVSDLTQDLRPVDEINREVMEEFVQSKRVEGRAKGTLYNYTRELEKLFLAVNKDYRTITAQDIRTYMDYRKEHDGIGNHALGNIRLYLMSFFKWCCVEEKMLRDPMNKIGPIRREKKVIETLTDEEAEMIRCACENERELAIIDLLAGSGMRVTELVNLNIRDVNFDTGEVKVFGKGSKERICFLTGKSKVHLKWYLQSRNDNNEALFVSSKYPHTRLSKNGVEFILKGVAKRTIPYLKLHPHKYRRTLATNMLNKGADITSIQHILGHQSSDTTIQCYARMDNSSLKNAHHTYVS